MANALAIRLDRLRLAEMSCIAGVGGDVPSLVRLAKSGRPILAIDGCKLHCVRNCLARHGLRPNWHETLTDQGVQKRFHQDYDSAELDRVFARLVADLDRTKGSITQEERSCCLSEDSRPSGVGC
jgi:uncharacterized metal-binding protein